MDRKQLKSSEKACSVLRTHARRSRFNPMASRLQLPLRAKNSKHLNFNINSLPEEILIEIFKYLTHNELALVSRVCRRWNETTKNPVLWKKIDVNLSWCCGSQNEIATIFANKLCSSVTHLRLNFDFCDWNVGLNFEELCVRLKEICPCLHTLRLDNASFLVDLVSVIDLCSEFLPNLKVLMLPVSSFGNDCQEREHRGHPKIEVLDISGCGNVGRSITYSLSKMPCLKKLDIAALYVANYFWEEENFPFLHLLESLNLDGTDISSRTFRILQNHAVNLTELFLCWINLDDEDLVFSNSVFPLLKTICVGFCKDVTCEGIISLVQSCKSLQNIYVREDVAQSYASHPFVAANICMLGIVKAIDSCLDH